MQKKTGRQVLETIFSDGFLIIYFMFALFPIVWMVLISLKPGEELF
jgi:multiple sugar transport system permease protein